MERYVADGIEREYRINRQVGTFKRHYGDSLSWNEEKKLKMRKSSVRWKAEYVFHMVKDMFGRDVATKLYYKTEITYVKIKEK